MGFDSYHFTLIFVIFYLSSVNQIYYTKWYFEIINKRTLSSIYSIKLVNVTNAPALSRNITDHLIDPISSNHVVSSITTDSILKSNQSFYPITEYLKIPRPKTIAFTYLRNSGFANRFRSMRGALLLAMLNNASFCFNFDSYYSVMDDQLSILKCKHNVSGIKWDDRYIISRFQGNQCNYSVQQNTKIESCYDMFNLLKQCSNFTTDLMRINPLIPRDNLQYYLSKFFFRPKPYIVSYGNSIISKMNGTKVGIQLRFGGSSAYSKEQFHFLEPDNLDSLINKTKSILDKINTQYTVFLSTDSYLGKHVISSLNVPYLTAEKYQVGHTGREKLENLQRAITDLYILSKCNVIITTWYSSFGDLARLLSNLKAYYILSNL